MAFSNIKNLALPTSTLFDVGFSKIKNFAVKALPSFTLFGVGFYIYNESVKKNDYHVIKSKINKLICNNNMKNLSPGDIYSLQFIDKKREYYKKYVTYPGNIIDLVLFPISVITITGGAITFSIGFFITGCCLNYLVVNSNIVDNTISKMLDKNNLIIDKNDFLNIDEIEYCHKIATFDIEGCYTYSIKDALLQKKLDRLQA
jgi:hypothetical protein